MFRNPTEPSYVGYGPDEVSNLKLSGRLAAILIGHGHEAKEATDTGSILAKHHAKEARPILGQKDAKAYSSILMLCTQHKIALNTGGSTAAVTKLQQFFRRKHGKKHQTKHDPPVDLAKVSFVEGSFVTTSGTKMTPTSQWTPTLKGIGIATLDQVMPYIEQNKQLSLEGNTAIVSQAVEGGSQIAVQPAEIMVGDEHHNRALIRVHLIHFGQTKIVPAEVPGSDVIVEKKDNEVLVLQIIRAMTDHVFWDKLIKAPAKTLLAACFHDTEPLQVIQLWSRRWTCGNKPCTPQEAEAFSILVRVPVDDLNSWLKRSGTGPIAVFASRKIMSDSTEQLDPSRVIWVSKTIHEAVAAMTQTPDHLGLVYRHPSSFGIRFDQKRFPSAWKELKNSDELPNLINVRNKYILTGVPFGMSGAELENWGKEAGWPFRSLKKFQDHRFLIGAPNEPPSYHFMIGKKSVILLPYDNKVQRPDPQILLGKLHMPSENPKGTAKPEDTLSSDDPWDKFRRMNGMPLHNAPQKSTAAPSGALQVPVDQGTTEVMSKQSQRLSDVEAEIQQIKSQMQQNQVETQQRFSQVDTTIQSMGAQLKHSLESALKQQSESLVQTFENLMKKSPRESAARPSRSRSPKMEK
eukprot:Skav204112  [mRNA]  locus=scaffold5190:71944:73839:- [translate_table: standard]